MCGNFLKCALIIQFLLIQNISVKIDKVFVQIAKCICQLISGCAMCGNSLKCAFIIQTNVGQMSTDAQAEAHPKVQCQQSFWKDQNSSEREISDKIIAETICTGADGSQLSAQTGVFSQSFGWKISQKLG